MKTVDVPAGQTRQVSGTYLTEEGGVIVTKSVTLDVQAGARDQAVAEVETILHANERTVTDPKLEALRTAENNLNSGIRGMYSVEFRQAEATAAAEVEARVPTQQALAKRAFLRGNNVKSTATKQAVRTRTRSGPPSFEPHTYGAFSATSNAGVAIVGQLGNIERQYPLSDPMVARTQAGFPPAFLTTDVLGRVFADNRNGNVPYGGRLFRFTPVQPPSGAASPGAAVPLAMNREFVGTIKYFSLDLMTGHPAYPAAMAVGPVFWDLGEGGVYSIQTQDLFVADIDVADGGKRILRIPVSLLDTRPSTFSEASGNRNRIVGQPYVESDTFQFTGPSDMEVGPGVSSDVPLPAADGVIMLSDEATIFAIFSSVSGGQPELRRVVQISNHRWSGLAFDRAGKFYFADYVKGEVWMMTWARLRTLIWSDAPLADEAALRASAYLVALGFDHPGDIEIEQGSSAHPGRSLFVSTFWGVDKRPLPIVGRLAAPVKEMKIKRLQKEDDVHVLADGLTFFVVPTYDDLAERQTWLRVRKTDPDTGADTWVEPVVVLAEHGATVLEGFAP